MREAMIRECEKCGGDADNRAPCWRECSKPAGDYATCGTCGHFCARLIDVPRVHDGTPQAPSDQAKQPLE